ncbi:GlxA family transcriptional regulator [Rhodobacteraceae bacterium KMM 6894]|nr:GlxA family transcriptional regulator [Rhodobacteraceae bacterium KMM 6894]
MSSSDNRTRIFFGLLPGYSALSFAGALEALKYANDYATDHEFIWQLCTQDGQPVPDLTGLKLPVDTNFVNVNDGDIILVCGGEDVLKTTPDAMLHWLRRNARHGARIGGLNTGSLVLAKAGVLNGAPTTVHWRNRLSFLEEFPDETLTDFTYTTLNERYSTAGGTASIDLMLYLIEVICGEEVAHAVSGQLNYTKIRVLQDSERVQSVDRAGFRHPKLSVIISLMETNLEEPLRPGDLAQSVNISTRQLERLFRRYLKSTPKSYYTKMRLEHARNLLLQSNMAITDIALVCGFGSTSHFSRRFREHFEIRPLQLRRNDTDRTKAQDTTKDSVQPDSMTNTTRNAGQRA